MYIYVYLTVSQPRLFTSVVISMHMHRGRKGSNASYERLGGIVPNRLTPAAIA